MKNTFRLIALSIATAFTVTHLQAQNNSKPGPILSFADYARMPERVIYSSYANDGQYLYSLNGILFNKRVSTQALRFDTAANEWRVISNKLMPKTNSTSVYVPSVHKIYTMGGVNAYAPGLFYRIETVDTRTGEVKILKTENPNPQMNCGMAVWNDKIYVFGGSASRYGSSKLYEFDVKTEKFKRLADMPYNAETSGTVVNGVLYTFGGYNPYNAFTFSDAYAYDIQSNSWKHATKLPVKLSGTGIAQYGNYIFTVGSYGDPNFVGYYNTETGQYIKLNTNMAERRFASSGIIGNRLFVFGGSSSIIDPGVIKVQGAILDPLLSAQGK